ncbi:MAG: cation:proton antiporter subunit C [Acidobacteria bacterium]|jgi:multicomponent Na+:H+ antiporter subunit C|nr:cation:proton antiporter subunit C [Acidobacteriota bacterium]
MIDYFLGHYAYWFTLALMIIGLYGMTMKRNLVKKIIGMSIVQVAVILFYVNSAVKWGATIPILDPAIDAADSAKYINPLPHCLMLTAIVVGVATTGVAFALVITIWKRYKTLDESQLLERMKKENELPG